jgi:hypothetical protein
VEAFLKSFHEEDSKSYEGRVESWKDWTIRRKYNPIK